MKTVSSKLSEVARGILRPKLPNLKTFKNKNFEKRSYEGTDIVFCISETPPNENWLECEDTELENSSCTQLYIENFTVYFGYL